MEEKKVKHYTNFSLVVFLLIILLACFVATLLFSVMYVGTYIDINIYAFDVIILVVGYFVAVSLYFVGKLIFGKLAGYRLINFNFWTINFIKSKDKLLVRRGPFEGMGCIVKMAPNKEKTNHVLYLMGGTIFTLPISIIMITISFFLHQENDLKYYLLFIFAVIPFVVLANIIPVRSDTNNDGFTLRLIKDQGSSELFNRNLTQLEALTNGVSELKYYEILNASTPLELDALYYNYYYLIDTEQYTKANKICEELILKKQDITEVNKIYLGYTGKIYELCRQKRFEESDRFFWELKNEIRNEVKNKSRYESLKICLYIASYMETNYDEYLNLYYRKEKVSKTYPYLTRIDKEAKIIEETIKAIQNDHPDWYVE